MKTNKIKLVRITLSMMYGNIPLIKINNAEISQEDHVKYFDIYLDKRLN